MNLFEKMFPEFKTDHEGLTLGDVFVLLLSAALLIYTGWRSYDVIRTTLPEGDSTYTIIAIVGLFALDLGMLAWALVWMFGSTTQVQDWISMGMWGVDAIGVVLAVIADTFLYTPGAQQGGLITLIQTVVWWAVPVLAAVNGLMGFVYHMAHPAVKRRRRERRLRESIEALRLEGDFRLRRNELEAEIARDLVNQRKQALEAYKSLVASHQELNQVERRLVVRLLGEDAAQGVGVEQAIRQVIVQGEGARPKSQKKGPEPQPGPSAVTTSDNHRHPQVYPEKGETWE